MNILGTAIIGIVLLGGIAGTYFTTTDMQMDTFTTIAKTNKIENRAEMIEAYFTTDGKIEITNLGAYESKIAKIEVLDKDNNIQYSKIYGVDSPNWAGIDVENEPVSIASKEETTILAENTIQADIGMMGYIITDNGNSFPIKNDHVVYEKINNEGQPDGDGTNGDENTASSMIDGMGLKSRIIQIENDGKITHGNGMIGKDDSIKPYLPVASNTDFAATVLDGDNKITHFIPAFWKSYAYTGSSLTDNTPSIPNILGYTSTKTMSGTPSLSISPNGISASGTGTIVLKLQDTTPNSIIRGTISNADVKIVTSPLDLTALSMSGSNYILAQTTPSQSITSSVNHWHPNICRGGCSGGTNHLHQTWNMVSTVNLVVAQDSDLEATYSTSQSCTGIVRNNPCHNIGPGYNPHGKCYYSPCYRSHAHSFSGSGNSVLTTSTVPDGMKITTQITTGNLAYYTSKTHTITSVHPWNEQHHFTNNFEQSATIPTNSYLVIKLTGGSALIKAESGTNNQKFINIDGLNSNIPYQITKNNIAISTGMTSATGQINFNLTGNVPSLTGGTLELYPDSLAYRGSFSTVVFDNLNGETIHIPTVEDKTYVVHAYANIPVTGAINVTNTNLDGTLNIPYLDGTYVNGDAIQVPVIPGYQTINLTINGVAASQNYSDILGGTGIKIADPTSGTITNQDLTNSIHSITTSAGTPTFVVATADGTVNAVMSMTISGTATLSNSYTLSQIPTPPPSPVRKDPLEGFVEVYNNGVLVHTQTLGINPNPGFVPTNTLSGNIASQSVTYTYGDYSLSGSTSVNVSTGDFVEFYMYGKITGDIETYSPPSGMQIDSERGSATATVNIRDAHIQTS